LPQKRERGVSTLVQRRLSPIPGVYWIFSVTVLALRPFEVTTTGTVAPETPAGTEQLI
jgi:hypothetical protein